MRELIALKVARLFIGFVGGGLLATARRMPDEILEYLVLTGGGLLVIVALFWKPKASKADG